MSPLPNNGIFKSICWMFADPLNRLSSWLVMIVKTLAYCTSGCDFEPQNLCHFAYISLCKTKLVQKVTDKELFGLFFLLIQNVTKFIQYYQHWRQKTKLHIKKNAVTYSTLRTGTTPRQASAHFTDGRWVVVEYQKWVRVRGTGTKLGTRVRVRVPITGTGTNFGYQMYGYGYWI